MDYSDNHIKKLEALLEEKQSIVISIKNDFTKAVNDRKRVEEELKSTKLKKEASDFANFIDKLSDLNNMDDANKEATHIMCTQGVETGIKHMFTDQDTGRELTYSEMRSRFG
jgi:molecular chaperone GrpE (heat shock protein)